MTRIAVLYASKYGQTERIAKHIAHTIRESGNEAITHCLSALATGPDPFSIDDYDGVILGGPVYYGRHTGQLAQFIKSHADQLNEGRSFFYSVSLAAASDAEAAQLQAHTWRDDFLAATGWNPLRTVCLAGALPYRDYNLFTRWVMKRIVKKEGGDTDTSKNHDYADWDAIAEFALACVDEVADASCASA